MSTSLGLVYEINFSHFNFHLEPWFGSLTTRCQWGRSILQPSFTRNFVHTERLINGFQWFMNQLLRYHLSSAGWILPAAGRTAGGDLETWLVVHQRWSTTGLDLVVDYASKEFIWSRSGFNLAGGFTCMFFNQLFRLFWANILKPVVLYNQYVFRLETFIS